MTDQTTSLDDIISMTQQKPVKGKPPAIDPMKRDAGFQRVYDQMPWYQKTAVQLGHGLYDTLKAGQGVGHWIANKVGLDSDADF